MEALHPISTVSIELWLRLELRIASLKKMCRILLMFILCQACLQVVSGGCNRIPQGATGERSAVDDNFKILIDGNPTTYIPDHQYNGELRAQN